MTSSERRDFDGEAATWDEKPSRVKLANDLADTIIREVGPTPEFDVVDYGCGTGLVTLRLQPLVRSITGVDSSRGMLDVLRAKAERNGIENLRAVFADLTQGSPLDGAYDLLVNTMALHHVPDPAALFGDFRGLLRPGGLLGLADLDMEDGSFHNDNTGVFHFGFDRTEIEGLLRSAGFEDVRTVTAAAVEKQVASGRTRTFSVFLAVARRPSGH